MSKHTPTPAEVIAEIESEERARAAAHSRVTCIDGSHARAAIAYLRSHEALVTALLFEAEALEAMGQLATKRAKNFAARAANLRAVIKAAKALP